MRVRPKLHSSFAHDRANVNAPTSGQSGGRSTSQMVVWQTTLLFDNGHLEELEQFSAGPINASAFDLR